MKILWSCLFLLFILGCKSPGWNESSDGEAIYKEVFQQEKPDDVIIERAFMCEFRTLFLTVENWAWFIKFSADAQFVEKLLAKGMLHKVYYGDFVLHEKRPSWFNFLPRNNYEYYVTTNKRMIFARDTITDRLYLTDSGFN